MRDDSSRSGIFKVYMAKKSNIVHQYFKKETKGVTIFVQFNPIQLTGARLTVLKNGDMELEELEFESDLPDQLKEEGYEEANPLEYHILINGLR